VFLNFVDNLNTVAVEGTDVAVENKKSKCELYD
jgi:hypothetical protein